MTNTIRCIAISTVVAVLLFLTGCVEQSTAPVEFKDILGFIPKGTISGKIYDRCTNMPIHGAVISVGYDGFVGSTISDASGSFSLANVAAGTYKVLDGRSVTTGNYLITASLVDYNKQQTDSTKRYRNYYYYPVSITFTSFGDSVGVSGLVGTVACSIATLSAVIQGTVVDQNIKPVAGASVAVYNQATNTVMKDTITGPDGSFKFFNVENGLSFHFYARSADGSQEVTTGIMNTPCNLPWDSLRTQVLVEQIKIVPVDNVAPFVTLISPENKADVPVTGLQIVYSFSEPIKQTAYTRTDLGLGSGTIMDDITINYNGFKKTNGSLPLPTIVWNPTFTQMIITPSGLVGSAKYTLNVVTALSKLKDNAGNAMVNDTMIIGDFEPLNFTTTGSAPILAAPANFVRRFAAGANGFTILDYTGGLVNLQWDNVPGARSYNIYRSIGNGSFELYHKDVYKLMDTVSTGPLVNPAGAVNPLSMQVVQYQVRTVNTDLVEGSPGNTITVQDNVQPFLLGTAQGGGGNNWSYTLQFSEPLTINDVQTFANYWIQDHDTVTFSINDVEYLGYNASTTRYDVRLNFSTNLPLPAGFSIRMKNLSDLAGNIIDSVATRYVSSVPPAPVLTSPNNGATGFGLPVTLNWNKSNGAISYILQVSTNIGFTGIVFDSNTLSNSITGTSYSITSVVLTAGVTYYWRVYAVNTIGTSSASSVRNFTP